MRRAIAAAVGLSVLWACGKQDSKWVEQRQKASDEAKAEAKSAHDKEIAPAAPKAADAPKDSYWDDPNLVRVDNEMKCPDGLWALFPGKAPGIEKDEEKANEAQRAGLAKKHKAARFVTYLKPPTDVHLLDYDAPKGHFPLQVAGLVDCADSFGHLSLLFTPGAEAITPGRSAAKKNSEVVLRIWEAKPFDFLLPMKSMQDAKDWRGHHQFDLEARVVFTLGKIEVDKKMFKTSKVSAAGVTLGGGNEDWGAGRAIRANVEGVRVTTDKGRTVLQDTRKK
jgi:hypothetical protein